MTDTPVLIVGAGPVGLSSALLLARQGIASTIVERRPARAATPRAHAVNPRTLEICRALGIPRETFVARAAPAEESRAVLFVTRLGGKPLGVLPYERQDAGALEFTPTPLLNIAQPLFETILEGALRSNAPVSIRRGAQWTGAAQDASGVVSSFADGTTISSRWLIAADGAESAVRKSLGITMVGPQKLQHRLMIHFAADLRTLLKGSEAAIYWIMDPRSQGGFIAFDMGANWVFMYRFDPDEVDPASFSDADCEALVRAAIDGEAGPIRILGRGPWALSVQLAEKYREGRIFLAGDAAHRFPPTGGLGLNTGVQDAHNLAWKIAMVERGEATPALLDSYEAERRPIADVNAAQSYVNARHLTELFAAIDRFDARPGGLAAALDAPDVIAELEGLIADHREHFDSFGLQLGLSYGPDRAWTTRVSDYTPTTATGARMPHAWIEVDGRRVSTLDLLTLDRFTLVCGPDAERWRDFPALVQAEGETFGDPSGHWARVAGVRPGEAVLVRPDGHIVGRGDDPAALAKARDALLNPGSR